MTAARLPKDLPSVEYLRECLDYNPETGVLTWKERPRSHFATDGGHKIFNAQFPGKRIVGKYDKGYICLSLNNLVHKAHRVIWAIYHGSWPADQVDHINMDKSDNRIANLKEATADENSRRMSLYRNNRSGIIGVSWAKHCNRWKAYIGVNGRQIVLGYFAQKEDAIDARKKADSLYGYASNHGEPNPTKITPTVGGCVRPNNTSGIQGCCWHRTKERWEATISVGGKKFNLGSFDTLEEAAAARRAAEIAYGVTNRKGRGKVALDLNQ